MNPNKALRNIELKAKPKKSTKKDIVQFKNK